MKRMGQMLVVVCPPPISSLAGRLDLPLDPFRDRVATNYLFAL